MSGDQGSTTRGLGVARSLFALAAVVWIVVSCAGPGTTAAPSGGGGGDPRSSGQGPGLVGDPLFAIAAVVGIGLAAAILTLAYVRMTGRQDR